MSSNYTFHSRHSSSAWPAPPTCVAGNPVTWTAEVMEANDYYPFGQVMPSRTYALTGAKKTRFGFNGKEKDAEVNGDGVIYDYGFRIYDARLGRFLSVDPLFKTYPWYTPYQFAGNKPITSIDIDGLEDSPVNSNTSPTEPNATQASTPQAAANYGVNQNDKSAQKAMTSLIENLKVIKDPYNNKLLTQDQREAMNYDFMDPCKNANPSLTGAAAYNRCTDVAMERFVCAIDAAAGINFRDFCPNQGADMFEELWQTSDDKLKETCPEYYGMGPPGVLALTGLTDKVLTKPEIVNGGLKPGAIVQGWNDASNRKDISAGTTKGHVFIFVDYVKETKTNEGYTQMIIADQNGTHRTVSMNTWKIMYGANYGTPCIE